MEIPGFARPVNAFFTSDSNTAYVINCGVECGSTSGASVQQLDIPSQDHQGDRAGGRRQRRLAEQRNSCTWREILARPGTYDAVDVSTMTRLTANSVAIGDGYHTTMALSTNNKLYIGASTCINITTGCLSVVDAQQQYG